MKIYLVHIDELEEDREFNELTDQEIEKMYKDDNPNVACYSSIEALCNDWNDGWIFNPDFSFMRVVQ